MREIKFRAWDTEKNKMVKVDTIDFNNGNVNDVDFYNQEIHFGYSTVLIQYTGLKDKNGTDIYEGDVLTSYTDEVGEVVFDEGAFFLDYGNIYDFLFECTDWEIIGNVYENPELLEDTK